MATEPESRASSGARTRPFRRLATHGLLAALFVWPAAHYAAWRAWKIDVWHLAGWSMYGVPRIYDDIHVSQIDGNPIPMSLAQQHRLERITRRAGVLRYGYDPTDALTALVESMPPESIDGLHFQQIAYPFNGRTGMFETEVIWDIDVPASRPRRGAISTYADQATASLESLDGTRWTSPWDESVHWEIAGDPSGLRFVRGPGLDELERFAAEGRDGSHAVAGPSAEVCAGYPVCVRLQDGAYVPVYVEGPQLWIATCVRGASVAELRAQADSDHREAGRVVMWRGDGTFCWVPVTSESALRVRR